MYAMVDKGDEIERVDATLGRTVDGPNNVSQSVGVTDKTRGEVVAVISGRARNSPSGLPAEFSGTIGDTGHITVPKDIIEEYDLRPGHRVRITVYEAIETEEERSPLESDAPEFEYAGHATVVSDVSVSDNCDSKLLSKEIYEACADTQRVKLANTRNQKTVETKLERSNCSKNRLNGFDRSVRRRLDTQPGDEIAVYVDTTVQSDTAQDLPPELAQQLREIHQMLSDVHEILADD